ncbi:hypothetical protein [Flavobacterium sp.]|uniref:hypothetical protein n=1 Tax=Flavobacterium sp. TaxID=239 RepID=UPI0011F4679F|nr:hypothetical protein [Flavobacterium sp.]RZJ71580.1 MAG: hypothetical protein EOO49_09485 [Flavobacterium sp.]
MQLTAMALNLMISERVDQREKFADAMKQIVDSESQDSHLADVFKGHLVKHIDRVVEKPNCSSRSILFALADFWNTFFKMKVQNPKLAA